MARRVREGHGKAAYALLTSLMISVIAIQVLAGIDGGARRLQTSFEPLEPRDETLAAPLDYGARSRIPLLHRLFDRAIISLHRH